MAAPKASETIPDIYRFLLMNVESLSALYGVYLCLYDPGQLLSGFTNGTLTSIPPETTFIYTMLGGPWLMISFLEAVVLRVVDDQRVWRLICAAILCSDIPNAHGTAQALGGWGEYLKVQNWSVQDWAVSIMTFPFMFARIAIVLGVGMKKGGGVRKVD